MIGTFFLYVIPPFGLSEFVLLEGNDVDELSTGEKDVGWEVDRSTADGDVVVVVGGDGDSVTGNGIGATVCCCKLGGCDNI